MNLLIIDTETTSLSPEDGEIIEIAAILYNVEERAILSQISALGNLKKDNLAFNINKISKKSADLCPINFRLLTLDFINSHSDYDYVVAHNAEFDRNFLKETDNFISVKPWICTLHDFRWPIESAKNDLVSIALELGVPVISAHRALTDCDLIARCFTKLTDLEERIEKSLIPKSTYIAKISFENRHKAKELGFTWNSIVKGQWAKKMTEEESELCKSINLLKM